MKNLGMLILVVGLALGGYSLAMDVSVDVPARDYGNGITTSAMQVANVDKMAQRQNFMIFSGILSVVGAILLGFGSLQPIFRQMPVRTPEAPRAPMSPEPAPMSPAPAPMSPEPAPTSPEPAPTSPEDGKERRATSTSGPKIVSICPKCRHMGNGYDVACGRCGTQLGV